MAVRMFEPVVIACDQGSWDLAMPIRSALELFRLRAYLHYLVQKRNAVDLLGGLIPEAEYVVLCCHGLGSSDRGDEPAAEMRMGFVRLVDEVDGEWQEVELALTPANIPDLVRLPGRKVLALGCGCGRQPLARAFLDSGCAAYIGAVSPPDQDAAALFAITFLYHLLRAERDPALACNDREAAVLAASVDTAFIEGTHVFRYHGPE
jgi:hypothetical protein